jgi:hypothetical protein
MNSSDESFRRTERAAGSVGNNTKNYIVNVPGDRVRTSTTFIQPRLYSQGHSRLYSAIVSSADSR